MSDLHLDDFYSDVARILLTLLQSFPRPHTLFVEDICGPDEPDEFGLHSKRHQACFAAMLWLADERYLRHEGPVRTEAIDQAVLSSRSLLLLNATPRHLPLTEVSQDSPALHRSRQTHARALRDAVKARDSFTLRQVVLDLMNQFEGT
ncbi:MAG: hypothetical protein AAGI15_08160 [Pseudomonadota bacterium]